MKASRLIRNERGEWRESGGRVRAGQGRCRISPTAFCIPYPAILRSGTQQPLALTCTPIPFASCDAQGGHTGLAACLRHVHVAAFELPPSKPRGGCANRTA
eukprot:scaffold26275_cov31-Tisochrysis_lutea.AAC.1